MPGKSSNNPQKVAPVVEELLPLEEAEEVTPVEDAPAPVVDVPAPVKSNKPVIKEAVVVAQPPGAKLVKIQFIVDHQFSIGVVRYEMKKGDRMAVELHMANLFAQRNIAYLVG